MADIDTTNANGRLIRLAAIHQADFASVILDVWGLRPDKVHRFDEVIELRRQGRHPRSGMWATPG